MYLPPHFRNEDEAALLDVIRAHPLGLLITPAGGDILADPLPFLIADGAPLRLAAHLARANPQVAALREGADVLVVFQAGNAYVSPGWYATKRETGKVVPTWNYVMVEVRGRARLHDDPQWLRGQAGALTQVHEQGRADPWAVEDAPEPFIAAQTRAIAGLEIEINALTGKFKLSQNRNEADRSGVIDGLSREPSAAARDIAARMRGEG